MKMFTSMKWILIFPLLAILATCASKPQTKPGDTIQAGAALSDLTGEWILARKVDCYVVKERGIIIFNNDGTGTIQTPVLDGNSGTGYWGTGGCSYDFTWEMRKDHIIITYYREKKTWLSTPVRVYCFFTEVKSQSERFKCDDGVLNLQVKRFYFLVDENDGRGHYKSLSFSGFDRKVFLKEIISAENQMGEGSSIYAVKLDTALKGRLEKVDRHGHRIFHSRPQ